jgi:hypothetical protein
MAFGRTATSSGADRKRAEEEKKRERLARREEESQKRKAERDGLLTPHAATDEPAVTDGNKD